MGEHFDTVGKIGEISSKPVTLKAARAENKVTIIEFCNKRERGGVGKSYICMDRSSKQIPASVHIFQVQVNFRYSIYVFTLEGRLLFKIPLTIVKTNFSVS